MVSTLPHAGDFLPHMPEIWMDCIYTSDTSLKGTVRIAQASRCVGYLVVLHGSLPRKLLYARANE